MIVRVPRRDSPGGAVYLEVRSSRGYRRELKILDRSDEAKLPDRLFQKGREIVLQISGGTFFYVPEFVRIEAGGKVEKVQTGPFDGDLGGKGCIFVHNAYYGIIYHPNGSKPPQPFLYRFMRGKIRVAQVSPGVKDVSLGERRRFCLEIGFVGEPGYHKACYRCPPVFSKGKWIFDR